MDKFVSTILIPIIGLLWIVFTMSFLVGCGSVDRHGAQNGPADTPGKKLNTYEKALDAFRETVYEVTTRDCAACHTSTTFPLITSGDLDLAYSETKEYVNFDKPSDSQLVESVMDGHCGALCNTDGSEMEEAIRFWWNTGEAALTNTVQLGGVTLLGRLLPDPMPSGGQYVQLAWNLETVDPDFRDALFSIEIQRIDIDNYELRNPTLTTGENDIEIESIRMLINGVYDEQNNEYLGINETVSANTTQVLSTDNQTLLVDEGEGDVIHINFISIRKAP